MKVKELVKFLLSVDQSLDVVIDRSGKDLADAEVDNCDGGPAVVLYE